MRNALITALVVLPIVLFARAGAQESSPAWALEHATLAPDTTPAPDSIALVRGIALRRDLSLRDGIIRCEIGAPAGGFAGIAFRMASTSDYEIIYFAPSDDGKRWKRVQYQPVYQGETTWQLYHREGYEAALPSDLSGPLRLRLVVAGRRADLYANDLTDPVLRIRELKREPAVGAIGFWAASPAANPGASRLSHLAADATASPALGPVDPERAPATQLMRWRVSPRFDSRGDVEPPPQLPAGLATSAWPVVEAEASGLINLTRAIGNPAGPQRVNVFGGAGWGLAYAAIRLTVDAPTTRRLFMSYSDGLGIYLNGRRLFTGNNADDSRYPDYLGLVGPELECVDLALAAGPNDLVLAITDKAFGWGFRARLDARDGLRVAP